MRIISGTLGGRTFNSPKGQQTHPMSEKIRGALFNVLGEIDGLRVLDAYSGSGAISLESISRGAASSVAIEKQRLAQTAISDNIKQLGLGERIELISTSVENWLNGDNMTTFDIIICDPPFDDINTKTIRKIASYLNKGGLMVTTWPAKLPLIDIGGHKLIKTSSYGDAMLVFYR